VEIATLLQPQVKLFTVNADRSVKQRNWMVEEEHGEKRLFHDPPTALFV
jgi:hypothetical protein